MFGGLRVGTPGVVFYFVSVLCERALVLRRCKDNENLRIKQAFHHKYFTQKRILFPAAFSLPFSCRFTCRFMVFSRQHRRTARIYVQADTYIRTGAHVYTCGRTRIYVRKSDMCGQGNTESRKVDICRSRGGGARGQDSPAEKLGKGRRRDECGDRKRDITSHVSSNNINNNNNIYLNLSFSCFVFTTKMSAFLLSVFPPYLSVVARPSSVTHRHGMLRHPLPNPLSSPPRCSAAPSSAAPGGLSSCTSEGRCKKYEKNEEE